MPLRLVLESVWRTKNHEWSASLDSVWYFKTCNKPILSRSFFKAKGMNRFSNCCALNDYMIVVSEPRSSSATRYSYSSCTAETRTELYIRDEVSTTNSTMTAFLHGLIFTVPHSGPEHCIKFRRPRLQCLVRYKTYSTTSIVSPACYRYSVSEFSAHYPLIIYVR